MSHRMTQQGEQRRTVRQVDLDHLRIKRQLWRAKLQCKKKELPMNEQSVLVLPLPPEASKNWILEYFSQFGTIINHIFRRNYVYMEYAGKENAHHLVTNQIMIHQWSFNIHPLVKIRKNKINTKIIQEKTEEANNFQYSQIMEISQVVLKKLPTFNRQLTEFMNFLQPEENQLATTNKKIFNDLYKILRAQFPKGKLFSYGSSVVGLALLDSDLDIFFDGTGSFTGSNKSIPQFDENTDSAASATFDKVDKLLNAHPGIFRINTSIPWARIPIIRFIHLPTETKCDISFKQGFGVYNSQLLKFCLTLDSRIKPLIIIIKTWAKQQNLFGKGKITNYPLVMLIFFYLQQPGIRLIPLIQNLQEKDKTLFKGWNVDFNENFPPTTSNCAKTIPQLLRDFFEFYSEFRFGRKMICPLNGKAPRLRTLLKASKERGKVNNLLHELPIVACLQDPIQLDWNVLSFWNQQLVMDLKTACKQTSEKMSVLEETFLLPVLLEPSSKI